MSVEQWFEPYGAPKHVHSDEDVRIRSDTGWYKQVLNALNVEVTTGVPYTHTSNSLCENTNSSMDNLVGRLSGQRDRSGCKGNNCPALHIAASINKPKDV